MAAKSISISTANISPTSRLPNLPSVSKQVTASKKRESKSEKSLETTLEKLTQNRHKEASSRTETVEDSKRNPEDPSKSESKEKVSPESVRTSGNHTEASQQSSTHSCTSNGKSPVHRPVDRTTPIAPTLVKKPTDPTPEAKESPASTSSSSNSTECDVSTKAPESDHAAKTLPIVDGKCDSPLRTVTNEIKHSDCNEPVKTSQCTEKRVDKRSGTQSVEKNNDLSDNKISEKIVEGGE